MNTHEEERIAAAWRGNLAIIDEDILFIRQHRRTLEQATERPEYLAFARDMLATRLQSYRLAIRRVSEAEEKMIAAGIQFTKRKSA